MKKVLVLLMAVVIVPTVAIGTIQLVRWSGLAFWLSDEKFAVEYLIGAATHGQVDEVKRVLRSGRATGAAHDAVGATALMAAVAQGNAALVRVLLDGGARVNSATHTEKSGRPAGITALMIAAQSGNLDAISMLLDAGADPNMRLTSQPWNGEAAIGFATRGGHARVVEALLKRGARTDLYGVDVNGNVAYPLLVAATLGRRDIVEMLLAHGASMDLVVPVGREAGCTLLMLFAGWRPEPDPELARLLGSSARTLNWHSTSGPCKMTNAMMNAELVKNFRVALALFRLGADPNPAGVPRLTAAERPGYERSLLRPRVPMQIAR